MRGRSHFVILYIFANFIIQNRAINLIVGITNDINGEPFQILMNSLEPGAEMERVMVLYEQLKGWLPSGARAKQLVHRYAIEIHS